MKGTVKWYNPKKGYGFIQGDDEVDVFIHHSAIPEGTGYIHEGDKVEYEVEKTDRGLNAKNVKKLEDAQP
jgi:CspA family cold shock protein